MRLLRYRPDDRYLELAPKHWTKAHLCDFQIPPPLAPEPVTAAAPP